MLRNMREEVVKEDVAKALGEDISYVKDIRLVSRKGTSSFAFVEFYESKDATRWMEKISAVPLYLCGAKVDVDYSRNQRDQWKDRPQDSRDWVCFKCNSVNFSRRRFCMMCDCPRSESDQLHEDVRSGKDSGRAEDNAPSNVLIMKGLDGLSNESSIRLALSSQTGLQQPRDVRVIRDHVTNTSRGFCFLEFSTAEEASTVLHKMLEQKPAFFVDGRRITVTYARGQNARGQGPTHKVASAAIAQAQWSMSQAPVMNSSIGHQESSLSNQSASQWQQPSAQPTLPQNQSVHPAYQPVSSTTSATVSAASTAVSQSQTTTSTTQEDLPSTYSFDPTSGFYYDCSTGLYYDPKTQYHYNSKTGYYCYFDSTQQAYISVDNQGNPIPSTASSTASTTVTSSTVTTSTNTQSKKSSDAPIQKPLNAKKIAKDMERWAKNVNAAKAAQKQQLQALIQLERSEVVARETMELQEEEPEQPSVSAVKRSGISLSAALEQDTASEKATLSSHAADVADVPGLPPGADSDPSHIDWTQLACLLCKRKFPSKEVLIKHQQFSDLHKKNLENAMKSAPTATPDTAVAPEPSDESQAEMVYRDRAKERRDKYGTPAIIPGWKKRLEREIDKASFSKYEQPTVKGLQEDNLGNKMLKAMGWSKGQGLGKANQGIVEPIKAHMRQVGAGLGASGSSHGLYSSAGTYKETLRQLTKSRYDSVFKD